MGNKADHDLVPMVTTLSDACCVYFWHWSEATFTRAWRGRKRKEARSYCFIELALEAASENIRSKNDDG